MLSRLLFNALQEQPRALRHAPRPNIQKVSRGFSQRFILCAFFNNLFSQRFIWRSFFDYLFRLGLYIFAHLIKMTIQLNMQKTSHKLAYSNGAPYTLHFCN